MATSERESGGRPFGIAHLTVVPANFDPERAPGEEGDRPDERPVGGARDGAPPGADE